MTLISQYALQKEHEESDINIYGKKKHTLYFQQKLEVTITNSK